MTRLALTARILVKPDHRDDFLRRVVQQRDDSLAHEPGCSRFDVTVPLPSDAGQPHEVVLYEVYADAAAIEAHRRYPHYLAYKAATAGWTEAVEVTVRSIVD